MASTMAMMTYSDAKEDLDDISMDNLKCGRITKQTLCWAIEKAFCAHKQDQLSYYGLKMEAWRLADVLNDLLEAARECDE